MISINIDRGGPTIPRPGAQVTEGSDLIRTDAGDQTIVGDISDAREDQIPPTTLAIMEQLAAAATVTDAEALHAIYGGTVTRPLSGLEAQLNQGLFDPGFMQATFPSLTSDGMVALPTVDTLEQAVAGVEPLGTYYAPVFGVPLPNLSAANALFIGAPSQPFDVLPAPTGTFGGNDRIFDDGGDNTVIDLAGDNYLVMEGGDDTIVLGAGNDRVIDDGGDNAVFDSGGGNNILTGDGDDTIKTGAGADLINARDGTNTIDAGEGDNFVRGGGGRDEVRVGSGDDIVELFAGSLLLDGNGDPVPDPDDPGAFLEDLTDPIDLGLYGVPLVFEASNVVYDDGGDDVLRATASSREDNPDFVDTEFNGADLAISDITVLEAARGLIPPSAAAPGDDRIELGSGQNLAIDYAGDNTVRTLEGDDFVFTSLVEPGADDIATGAGSDQIDPGGGADRVRAGPGDDLITITEPGGGSSDTLVYNQGDVLRLPDLPPSTTPSQKLSEIQALTALSDLIAGFEGAGAAADGFELNDLGVGFEDLHLFNPATIGLGFGGDAPDLALVFDADGSGFVSAPTSLGEVLDSFTPGDFVLGVLDGVSGALPSEESFTFNDAIA